MLFLAAIPKAMWALAYLTDQGQADDEWMRRVPEGKTQVLTPRVSVNAGESQRRSVLRLCRALGPGAIGQRGRLDARPRQRAGQLLAPVRDVGGRAVDVHHPARGVADVRDLMGNGGRYVDGLARRDDASLLAQTHLGGALEDHVDLFLILVVPGHLAAV